jgi:hypothetical protein
MGRELKICRQWKEVILPFPLVRIPSVVLLLWFGLLGPAILAAQDASAPAKQIAPPLRNTVTFTQQSASTQPAPSSNSKQFTLPYNECSADFWDPYERESLSITQSPARVQQTPGALIDPQDRVLELPDEVAEPAARVQQLDSEVVKPLSRVQQLDDEVIKPADRVGGSSRPDNGPLYSLGDLWQK